MFWLLISTALLMGLFMAIQPAINGTLRTHAGSPAQAALISTTISTLSLGFFVFVVARYPWPSLAELRDGPWWMWMGGLLGAAYVALSVVLVARLGGAVAFALVILGQMLTALAMDHFGWMGVPVHEITPQRLAGVGFVVLGVVMIRAL